VALPLKVESFLHTIRPQPFQHQQVLPPKNRLLKGLDWYKAGGGSHSRRSSALLQQFKKKHSPDGLKGMPPIRGKLLYCWPPWGGGGNDMLLLLLSS
jgi:hypothetical protein